MANTATLKPAKPPMPPALASTHATEVEQAPSVARTAFAMLSHRGRVRHENQDACAALPEFGAFVVCDGIGGAAAGEVASHLASEAFLASLAHPARVPHDRRALSEVEGQAIVGTVSTPPESSCSTNHPHTRLQRAVRAANQAVFRQSRKSLSMRGMGTTLVAALLEDTPAPTLWLAHVGDSRCYRFRRGVLHQLTHDHSLVEEQIQAGLLSRVQASRSPIRNIITRAIGADAVVEPDIAAHNTLPGDLFLLASDGLTRELADAEIARILARTAPPLEPLCQALVDAANAHGGRDNITVLLVAI